MDKAERQRLKQLVNDSIIATFGQDTNEARLAQALEQCVDELKDANANCPTCSHCENHGDFTDDSIPIEAGDVMDIHRELKKLLQQFRDYHVRLCEEVADDWDDPDRLTNPLAEIIEETESQIDELEALVTI